MDSKRLILSLFVSCICLSNIKAQDDDLMSDEELRQPPSGYIALNAGLSAATGDFAKANVGGALSGQTFQLSMCAPFSNAYLGIAGKVNYSKYSMTNQAFYSQQLVIMRKFDLDTNVTYNNNINQEITEMSFLVGMFGTFPTLFDDRLSLDARILFGPTTFTRPELSLEITDVDKNVTSYTQTSSSATSFASNFGFGLRYNLLPSKKMCIMLNFDYFNTRANFNIKSNAKYLDDSEILREGEHEERITHKISTYNITAGIGYVW